MRAVVLVVAATLAASPARAEMCQSAFGAVLTPEQATERAASLAGRLRRNRTHMRAWNITFFSVFASTAVAQGGIALAIDNRDDQIIFGVGAARAALGAGSIPILGVRTREVVLPGTPCGDLAAAENTLRENVRLHRKGRGWFKHAGVFALNATAFLALGLGYDLWGRAAIGSVVGIAAGEIQIYTQPMGSLDILDEYRRNGFVAPVPDSDASWRLTPYASDGSFGLAITGALR